MTLYDINKQAHTQLPKMTQDAFRRAAADVWTALDKNAQYFMLLCREKNDYTVFSIPDLEENYNKLWNEILDILMDCRGYTMKDIYPSENGQGIEYWVQDPETQECFMYLLFSYDWGVIEL